MSCKAITQSNNQCIRRALKSGYCAQHDKDEKIVMYKKELKRMHARVRVYISKIEDFAKKLSDVYRLDQIKKELQHMTEGERFISYRHILYQKKHQSELERIFDLPFDEIPAYYHSLLTRRNEIVHKHTMGFWGKSDSMDTMKYKKRFHN